MKKIIFGAVAVCAVLLSTPSFAQKVTMKIQNSFGATVTNLDKACTSSTCPSSVPSSIPTGSTSASFTATPITNTTMMRVTYSASVRDAKTGVTTDYACRFTAQTGKIATSGGACFAPVVQSSAYSGKNQSPTCTATYSQNSTCDLDVTFKIAP